MLLFWVAFGQHQITQQLIWHPGSVRSDEESPMAKYALHRCGRAGWAEDTLKEWLQRNELFVGLDKMPQLGSLSAILYSLHMCQIRCDKVRQWKSSLCWCCWLLVRSKQRGSRRLSRRWAWSTIIWDTGTVCCRSWCRQAWKMEKSWKFSRLCCQDQDKGQYLFVKTKTKTLGLKTKTLLFVLEAPRDQDFGLEDYITAVQWLPSRSGTKLTTCSDAQSKWV